MESRVPRRLLALSCALLLPLGDAAALAQQAAPPSSAAAAPAKPAAAPAAPASGEAAKLPPDQLDSLVAPIALYPDALLAQTLVAATYPLEIIQLQQWLEKNKNLKDKALSDAVAKQPWDPAIQSMAATPEVVKRLADDIAWTTDLGNAFLVQQSDVMDACQRMRKKAKEKGSLATSEQQKVETKVVEKKEVIVIESSNPEVIYVPSYNPTYVYPPPVYPYPPVYYPPYTPGAAFFTFSMGVMVGAAFWGGSCCHCGWGGGNVNINVNNNFNKVNHYNSQNINKGGNNSWQHNPSHRGGAPYSDKATANKYGGSARGDSLSSRQNTARQQSANRPSTSDRSAGGRGSDRPSASTSDRGGAGGGRSPSASTSNRSAGGGRDSIGSRDVGGGSSRGGGGFGGGGSSGFSGRSAGAASSRGSSSFSGRGGGGGGRRR